MSTFDEMLYDRSQGWGRWPGYNGPHMSSVGSTMKQLRSWAQYADAKYARQMAKYILEDD